MGYPDSLCGTVCGVSSGWRYADPFGCHQAEGAVYFEETFIHMFDSVTTIGLLLTLVMIFSFQGNTILEKTSAHCFDCGTADFTDLPDFCDCVYRLPGFEAALQDCCSRRNDLCFQLL